jgi:hypothetical protein
LAYTTSWFIGQHLWEDLIMSEKRGSNDMLFIGFIGGLLFVLLMHYFAK